MIRLKTDWTAENLKKYILFTSFFGNKFAKLALIIFAVCIPAVLVTCIVMFCMIGMPIFLILAGVITVFTVGTVLFFVFTVKGNIKNALASSTESDPDNVVITESAILLCKGNEPFGELDWEKITDISFNDRDKAAYLSAEGGSVLILEYKNITLGSEEKLREMLSIKNVKLSKKA
ncbi:MAG: hypothetical protein HDT46_09765 [Ruminococcaceae bacterium]|nr:hypothetical protein [Oscillospiraceae bacterium]MBD5116838.1 hypothetical protein [Oscillospiraceae bacterium]